MPALVTTRLLPTATPLQHVVRRWSERLAGPVLRWPVSSQLGARRNAMLACTALAARRAERDEVADFLSSFPEVPTAGHG